jgi:hypothetical protein
MIYFKMAPHRTSPRRYHSTGILFTFFTKLDFHPASDSSRREAWIYLDILNYQTPKNVGILICLIR